MDHLRGGNTSIVYKTIIKIKLSWYLEIHDRNGNVKNTPYEGD
jgi:hypothetical protein